MPTMIARLIGPRPMVQLLGWRYIEEHRTIRFMDYPNGKSGLFVLIPGIGEISFYKLSSFYRQHAHSHGLTSKAFPATVPDRFTQPFTLSSLTEVGDRHNNTVTRLSSDQVVTTLTYKPAQAYYFIGDNLTYRAVLDTPDLTLAQVARAHGVQGIHSYRCRHGFLTYLPLPSDRRGTTFLREQGFFYVRSYTFGLPDEPEATTDDALTAATHGTTDTNDAMEQLRRELADLSSLLTRGPKQEQPGRL